MFQNFCFLKFLFWNNQIHGRLKHFFLGRLCVPFTQFLPNVTSYITIVPYQDKEIDIDNLCDIHRAYSNFTCFICVCVCVVLCSFITYVRLCNPHHEKVHFNFLYI